MAYLLWAGYVLEKVGVYVVVGGDMWWSGCLRWGFGVEVRGDLWW